MLVLGQHYNLPFSVKLKDIGRQLSRIVDASYQIPCADISLGLSQSNIVPGQIVFNGIPSSAMVAAGAALFSVTPKFL